MVYNIFRQKQLPMKFTESIFKLAVVALSLILLSCEEKFDIPLQQSAPQILVVDGMITSDTTQHEVFLSYTGNFYMEEETPRVSGAEVKIVDDLGNTFILQESQPGKYITDSTVYGVIGATYTLQVKNKGSLYEASSTMKRVPAIDSLDYRWDNQLGYYRILLYGNEPKGKGDNYMWHLYKNSQRVTDQVSKVQVANDEFIDGNYINGFKVDWWDNAFDFQIGDTITVAQHSITTEAFDYFLAVLAEHNNGEANLNPPANITSNVNNGALGLFHASAVKYATIIIE